MGNYDYELLLLKPAANDVERRPIPPNVEHCRTERTSDHYGIVAQGPTSDGERLAA